MSVFPGVSQCAEMDKMALGLGTVCPIFFQAFESFYLYLELIKTYINGLKLRTVRGYKVYFLEENSIVNTLI